MTEKIRLYFARIPHSTKFFLLHMILFVALLVSLMPIIAWWGGLVGLAYIFLALFLKTRNEKMNFHAIWQNLLQIYHHRAGRLSFYIVLFGLLVHGACRIHSELLIRHLHNEALQEKNIIVKTEQP